jgi:hypothetical protein
VAGASGRVRGRVRGLRRPHALPELTGALAGLWAAAIGLAVAAVPMLIVWMASTGTGLTWTEALRIAGLIWVVAHGTPVAIAGVEISLLPWGLTLIPLVLLSYAGSWAARRSSVGSWGRTARLVVAGALVYGATAGFVAQSSYDATSRVALLGAVLQGLGVAVLGLSWGSLRGARLWPDPRIPSTFVEPLRAGAVAVAAVLGIGALAAAASLMGHFDDAVTMTQSLGAGLGGGLALVVLGVAYVPVLVVWSSAYLLGAGVVVAPAVTLTPFIPVGAPAELPPLPVLAALPEQAPVFAWALPVVGVLAGVLAGIHIARTCRQEPRLVRLALAAGAAAVAGLLLAGASWLSSGALGDDRLAHLGPTPGTVGILAAVLVVIGAVPSAVLPGQPGRPRLRVARSAKPARSATAATLPDRDLDGAAVMATHVAGHADDGGPGVDPHPADPAIEQPAPSDS